MELRQNQTENTNQEVKRKLVSSTPRHNPIDLSNPRPTDPHRDTESSQNTPKSERASSIYLTGGETRPRRPLKPHHEQIERDNSKPPATQQRSSDRSGQIRTARWDDEFESLRTRSLKKTPQIWLTIYPDRDIGTTRPELQSPSHHDNPNLGGILL